MSKQKVLKEIGREYYKTVKNIEIDDELAGMWASWLEEALFTRGYMLIPFDTDSTREYLEQKGGEKVMNRWKLWR